MVDLDVDNPTSCDHPTLLFSMDIQVFLHYWNSFFEEKSSLITLKEIIPMNQVPVAGYVSYLWKVLVLVKKNL